MKVFLPRKLLQLAADDKGRIQSICVLQDSIFLGFSNGNLSIYSTRALIDAETPIEPVNDLDSASLIDHRLSIVSHSGPGQRSPRLSLTAQVNGFTRKCIDAMEVLLFPGQLAVLSDSQVNLYSLEDLSFICTLPGSKGASALTSFRPSSGPELLAVANKKKLLVFRAAGTDLTLVKELSLPERIRYVLFLSETQLICALSSDYCSVDISTGRQDIIAVPGTYTASLASYIGFGDRQPEPKAVVVQEGKALLVKDTIPCIYDTLTNPAALSVFQQVAWKSPPTQVCRFGPYLLAAFDQYIEVRSFGTGSVIAHVDVPHVAQLNAADGLLFAASRDAVFCLHTAPFQAQVDALAAQGRLEEAISMAEELTSAQLPRRQETLRELQIRKATQLFGARRYNDAMALFSEYSAPPAHVLGLFPRLSVSVSVSASTSASVAEGNGNNGNTEVLRSPVKSPKKSNSPTKLSKSSPSRWLKSPLLSPLRSPLAAAEEPEHLDTISVYSAMRRAGGKPTVKLDPADKQFLQSVRALMPYLADTRRKLSRQLSGGENRDGSEVPPSFGDPEEAARLVDTALFTCYMLSNPGLVGPLLRVPNWCDEAVVRRDLSAAEMWRELVDFYYTRQHHREALELLRRLGGGSDGSDGGDGAGSTNKGINDHPGNAVSHSFAGCEPTVAYLARLGNSEVDLILQFARWPLSVDPKYGETLFLADTEQSRSLDRFKVLQLLSEVSRPLTEKYLRHVIDLGEERPEFHTKLAEMLVADFAEALQGGDAAAAEQQAENLNRFLADKHSNYDASHVLSLLPNDTDFLVPKTYVLRKRGEHTKVLDILVHELGDHARAREYCGSVYAEDATKGQQLLHGLLAVYLRPGGRRPPQLEAARQLLDAQGPRMSVAEVLRLLPADVPVAEVRGFLRAQLRSFEASIRRASTELAVQKVHLVDVQEQLANLKSQSVVVSDQSACIVCNRRLGKIMVSVFPGGAVVHYGCCSEYRRRFQKGRAHECL